MKNKLLLSVAACSLLSLSNASAQVVTSFASLNDAVISTAIDKSYTLTANEDVATSLGIMGGSSLVIDGDNLYTITASNVAGIIVDNADTLTIQNVLDVTGFKRVGDGGIVVNNVGATTNIINSTFSENSATYGGVLRNVGTSNSLTGELLTYGTINITDSTFDSNVATTNSSFLSNSGIANITKSTISNNNSGAIGNTGEINIIGTSFIGNSSLITGGAIRNHTTGILNINQTGTEKTTFEKNQAASGGAIYTDKLAELSIKNTNFTSNTATGSGGAIWTALTTYTADISATFTSNNAMLGGAIYNTGNLSVNNSNFVSNNVTSNGGAIYNASTISAVNIDATFSKNYASTGQGGAIYNNLSATLNLIEGSFDNNYAGASSASYGGAIYNAGNISTINATFENNYTTGNNSKGGAIYNSGTIDTISGTFEFNGLNGTIASTSFGGAIYNSGTINSITNATFSGNRVSMNSAPSQGGAIHNDASGIIKSITATFTNNYVSGNSNDMAGAIYNAGTIESMSGNFTKNGNSGLTNHGGAIYNIGNINIIGGTYSENVIEASGMGGAIYNSGTMTIANTIFTDNSTGSLGLGGAIYNSGDLTISASSKNVAFSDNTTGSSDNAIHNIGTLDLNAAGAYTITMNDQISGDNSGVININTTTSGNVIINADILDNTINFYNGTLSLGRSSGSDGVVLESLFANAEYANPATTQSEYRKINTIDGFITNYTINADMDLYKTNLAIDMDLRKKEADNFTIDGNLSADTGVVLINITDFNITDTSGKITIFNNQAFNDNLSLLDGEINILDYQKKITLTQDPDDNGAYIYDIDVKAYDINTAMNFDASHTQYDMILATDGGLGDETVTSHSIGYFDAIAGIETGKDMVVNGYQGGSTGFTLTGVADASGSEAKITLESESTYYSSNANYDNINFYMDCNCNNSITFDMVNGFNYTTLDSDFSSKDIENELIFNGDGKYDITGFIENLTLNANSNVNLNGTITDSKVFANGVLTVSGAITNSTIDVKTMLNATSTITNSTITTTGLVERSGYDNGVTYNLNEGGLLSYTNLDYLYDSTQTELNSLNFAGGQLLGLQNNVINEIKLETLSVSKQSNISLDVDLANKTMDSFVANAYDITAGFNVDYLNIYTDATQDETRVSFTDNANLAANTVYTGMSSASAVSPLFQYQITYDDMMGDFIFSKGQAINAFNPAVYTSTIAKDAYTLASFDIFDEVLMNTDSLEIHKDKLGASSGDMPPYKKAWFKVFGSNEDIGLKHFDVDSQTYGGILGFDTDIQNKNGWNAVYSAYLAYVGAKQEYDGVDIKQNGAVLGVRSMMSKGNWFTGTTASIGTSLVEGTNSFGDEDFEMYSVGIANKTGYNLNLYCKQYFMQPSMTVAYLHTYTTDYTTAGGLSVADDSLNALQIKPEVKFVANLDNGLRPYAAVSYNWNILSNPEVQVATTTLPDLSVDPYVEYKLGASMEFNDGLSGYAEVSATSGGRDGFGAQLGVKWSF